jgi:hypothetical protein
MASYACTRWLRASSLLLTFSRSSGFGTQEVRELCLPVCVPVALSTVCMETQTRELRCLYTYGGLCTGALLLVCCVHACLRARCTFTAQNDSWECGAHSFGRTRRRATLARNVETPYRNLGLLRMKHNTRPSVQCVVAGHVAVAFAQRYCFLISSRS